MLEWSYKALTYSNNMHVYGGKQFTYTKAHFVMAILN